MSGWRRMVPVDEQGASSRTASKRLVRRSRSWRRPATVVAASPSRARFAESVLSRVLEMSTATTEAPASTSCAVLPPGAAQRSTTRLPATCAHEMRRQRGGDVLHPPRALRRSRGALRCAPWAGGARCHWEARAPTSARPSAAGSLFTVRSSGGSIRLAAAIACARSSP